VIILHALADSSPLFLGTFIEPQTGENATIPMALRDWQANFIIWKKTQKHTERLSVTQQEENSGKDIIIRPGRGIPSLSPYLFYFIFSELK